jgi:hypothetical protein
MSNWSTPSGSSSGSRSSGKPNGPEDRIRAIFALPEHAPLPKVGKESLVQYHEYLTARLTFPFQAFYAETAPPVRHLVHYVTVVGVSDSPLRHRYGMFCKVEGENKSMELPLCDLGIREDDPNFQLIEDYLSWLWDSG